MSIDPLVDLYMPFIQFNMEVFPAPLGPIIANKEFSSMSKDTSFNACTPPNLRFTFLNEITLLKTTTFSYAYSA